MGLFSPMPTFATEGTVRSDNIMLEDNRLRVSSDRGSCHSYCLDDGIVRSLIR